MKKIHLLVIKSYIGPFVLTFFLVVFLLLMQFLWKYIDDLVGKGLSLSVISELMIYTSASLVPMGLPLATMLASIMTFGNLGENNELIAMKSAGVSLQRIIIPLVILTVFISIGAFFFSNNILPIANLKMRSLLYDVQKQRPEINIRPGVFYNGIEDYSIKIAERDTRTSLLKDIMIYDHSEKKGNVHVTRADSGFMSITADERNLIFTLYNGTNYYEDVDQDRKRRRARTYPHRRDIFEKEVMIIELTGFGLTRSDEGLFKKNYQMLNLAQLEEITDSLNTVLDEKAGEFRTTLFRSYLFNQNIRRRYGVMSDSLVPEGISFRVDTAFHELEYEVQDRVSKTAINQARAAKNYVMTSKLNIVGRAKRIRKYDIEWHLKFTLSFACFIFFFIGAPLGAIVRKGGIGMPVVISTLFFVMYHIISTTGKKAAVEGVTSVPAGVWFSSVILLPLGIFLTYKATTDSVILNAEYYLKLQKKLFSRLGLDKWWSSDEETDENSDT